MRMTKGLIILLKPLLQHEIRDAQFMKINLIPYIGHLVRNCINALVGDNAAVGAAVIILPGRYVSNNSVIQAGTIYCRNEAVTRN